MWGFLIRGMSCDQQCDHQFPERQTFGASLQLQTWRKRKRFTVKRDELSEANCSLPKRRGLCLTGPRDGSQQNRGSRVQHR